MRKLQPHEQRMIDEWHELNDRVIALENFIDTVKYAELSEVDRDLIHMQRYGMRIYLDALNKRIERMLATIKAS